MELKDDFTNKYFRPDNIKSQMDLINQPTEVDAYADAFNGQANREAKGPAQRNSNALMAGLGAGLKGAANSKRQEQLSPILKMVGELNSRSAYLEAQMQQEQQQKMTMVKFLRENKSAIRDLGNASVANSPEAQEISKYLSNKFEIATGQNPGKFNSFDTKQRKTFYDQPNGSTVGYGFLDAVEPYAEEAYGEETTDILQNLSPYHNKKYKEAEEIQNLKMEKGHADIRNTNSQADYHNAQSTHLGMQDRKIDNEMNAPKPKYSEKTLNTFHTQNSQWINENREKHNNMNRTANTYDAIAKTIKDEVNDASLIGGRAGTGFLSKAQRFLNKSNTDSERNQAKLEMLKLPLMEDLKRIYGSRITNFDLEQFLVTLPSLDKNPDASITEAKNRAKEIREEIYNDNLTQEVLEDEFGYSEPYNSLAVQRRVQERLKSKQPDKTGNSDKQSIETQDNQVVIMQNSAGEPFRIPQDKVQAALNDPDEPLTLVK